MEELRSRIESEKKSRQDLEKELELQVDIKIRNSAAERYLFARLYKNKDITYMPRACFTTL
jgi:hypothetical protein